MTDDTITIGLAVDSTPKPPSLTFGYEAKYLPTKDSYGTVIREINRHGGIDGRTLKLHIWNYDFDRYPSMADYQAAECAHFTQDVEVFAVITSISDQNTGPCYESAGTTYIDPKHSIFDREQERAWPHYFNTASMDLDRVAQLMVSGLARQGFFEGEHRIGFITFDDVMQRRAAERSLKPALQARTLALTDEIYVTPPRSAQELGLMLQQINTAVVNFRAQNIDLVLILDADGIITNRFAVAAENQQYRGFRYGLTTMSVPGVVAQDGQTIMPGGQMENAIGVGWDPLTDVRRSIAEPVLPPGARRCLRLMERAGVEIGDRCCQLNGALRACDLMWFLRAGIEAGPGRDVTAESFRRGVERLGNTFESARTFAPRFGPDRHQGAYGYRNFAWTQSCRCITYTSELRSPDRR